MRTPDELRRTLDRIDGRPYPAYRDLRGSWELPDGLELCVDHVQGDPFAAPSRIRLFVPTDHSGPHDRVTRLALEDALLRRFGRGLSGTHRGSGRSGDLLVYRPGPEITERSALRLHPDGTVEIRMAVGLPARGRRVLGQQAWYVLGEDLPRAAEAVDCAPATVEGHVRSVRRQQQLRDQLDARGLVAFLADGSVLPRRSGVDPAPLPDAVPLRAPESLAITLDSDDGPVRGLGIRRGVTLIVGGGYHGKSTLLQAIQQGHLDHVPDDGREGVVTIADAVKVRAEDGRSVRGVDISPWLSDLPGGRGTRPFDSDDASGSTSQAAALAEALEAGARALLLDEDTSATNLLVRDERMRALVPRDREPITPFVERVRQLADRGVSTVMVVGGVGDYLAVADVVLAMDAYVPVDVTSRARALAGPVPEAPGPFPEPLPRVVVGGLQAGKIRARDTRAVRYGDGEIELSAVEQVLDASHAWTLGQAVRFVGEELAGRGRTIAQLLSALDAILDDEGVEALSPYDEPAGDLIRPRRFEVAAAVNRARTLRVESTRSASKPI